MINVGKIKNRFSETSFNELKNNKYNIAKCFAECDLIDDSRWVEKHIVAHKNVGNVFSTFMYILFSNVFVYIYGHQALDGS